MILTTVSDELHASRSGKSSLTVRLTTMMTALLALTLASLIGVGTFMPQHNAYRDPDQGNRINVS
jgi:hypothetical protein